MLIASPLEDEHVARIMAVDHRLKVTYRPELLGTPRYPGDHFPPISRTPAEEAEWARLLSEAEVLFDVDQPSATDFLRRAPRVRWIQASSSGIGEWVRRLGIVDAPIVATNAAGIHAVPLAEFVVFAMLYFAKNWPRMAMEQQAHHWERCAIDTLAGKTLGIIGTGKVGREVARMAKPFGLRILGVRRVPSDDEGDFDAMCASSGVMNVLRESDYVVLSVPHTSETVGLIGRQQLAEMRATSVLINIARGSVVDETALVEALQAGRLRGAALDVVTSEPLAEDSPLWSLPNVIITPHSASTAQDENARLTDLFCDNLRRWLEGRPLKNVIDKQRGY